MQCPKCNNPAPMTDLPPGQLVDVEFRWIERRTIIERTLDYEVATKSEFLQTRKLIKNDSGELIWTDWADVPVVEEG